jgi:hypothetical protein
MQTYWDRATVSPAACGAAALCARTINECEIDMEQGDCVGWYANTANCADMEGYLSCNCACLGQETCDGYFGCGESCYERFCGT